MDQEEKYLDIRDKLKNLEQVKASDSFVHNLHSKIVEIESEKRREHQERFEKGRGGFLKNLFGNMQYPWLIPAAGFTILIFFIFYMTYMNKSLTGSNPDLSTTQKQETQDQSNSGISRNKSTENNPTTTTESGTDLNKKDSTPEKDIAGDLNLKREKENSPVPTESMKEYKDNAEPKFYRKENESQVEKSTDELSDTKPEEKKLSGPEKQMKVKSDYDDKVSATPPASEQSGTTNDNNVSRGVFSIDTAKKGRLKEKIDSVSRIDLEKLRQEILK